MSMTTTRTVDVPLRTGFGFEQAPLELTTKAFPEADHPLIPKIDDRYVFTKHAFRRLTNFLDAPRSDFFYSWGHFGTGKTSLPMQIAARLNWPVLSLDGSRDFNPDLLIGRPDLQKGAMEFLYGSLVESMINGYIFIFNEVDSCPPGLLTALHDVAEGRPLVLHSNGGQVVRPQKNFRLICSGNSNGLGDTTGLYRGVQPLNRAFLDRARMFETKYPAPEVETKILEQIILDEYGQPEPETIRQFVEIANRTRERFTGDGLAETDERLTTVISTRGLVQWAELMMDYREVTKNPIRYALEEAILGAAEPEDALAITELARSIVGQNWVDDPEDD